MGESTQIGEQQAAPAVQTEQTADTQQQNTTGGEGAKATATATETPKSAGSLFLEGIEGDEGNQESAKGNHAVPSGEDKKEGKQEGEQEEKPEDKAAENKPLTKEDIVIPEGLTYDEEAGQTFLDALNDTSISRKDLMQKLANLYVEQQRKMLESIGAANSAQEKAELEKWHGEIKEWQTKTKADSEYGGQKWEASKAVIARGCDKLATPEAAALLAEYRLNAHPEIVRMFYRAGQLVGEDSTRGSMGTTPHAAGDGLVDMYRKSLQGIH